MHALHHEVLPPSGVDFATSLRLTTSSRAISHLVVARSNLLRIFELRLDQAAANAQQEAEQAAVEGAMEVEGDGFISVGGGVGDTQKTDTVTRFHFLREHKLHGIVTGIEAIKTVASIEDKLDRLLVSFKDAKIALLEWSEAVRDLVTVSIHTYERAPQLLMSIDNTPFVPLLRVDPQSRVAALGLPQDSLAILPFYQSQSDLPEFEMDQSQARGAAATDTTIPYSPSFILDLGRNVDSSIHNVIDFVFLPGFNNPTLAVLFATTLTWTGRLKEHKDTSRLVIFTLNHRSQVYPIITKVDGLPLDAFGLVPCDETIGGVMVITANALIYIDQASRRIPLPLNGWTSRISDLPLPPLPPNIYLHLEGSRSIFMDPKKLFSVLKDGSIYQIELVTEGKLVKRMQLAAETSKGPLAQTTIPAVLRMFKEGMIFVGSRCGPSVLLGSEQVEEELEDVEMAPPPTSAPLLNGMDLDDDDEDIYGPSKPALPVTAQPKRTRQVSRLSLLESLPAWGPIEDITFTIAKNGDRSVPELVAATGAGQTGGFTLFQRDLPTRTKRKLHAIGGARGLWSLPVIQPHSQQTSASSASPSFFGQWDTLLISTDANPSPGLSRIATREPKTDISIDVRMPGTTVGAGPFFGNTAVLHVMTNQIRLLEPDGSERQMIKDTTSSSLSTAAGAAGSTASSVARAKIRACSISDPFVLIIREDDTIGLFTSVVDKGRIRRKDMSALGDKSSRYLTGCFVTDSTGLFDDSLELPDPSGERPSRWLLLVRPQGVLEIWTLPKLALAFSSNLFSSLESIITDSHSPIGMSLPQDPPRKPQDNDVESICIAPLGESQGEEAGKTKDRDDEVYMFILLRSGHLGIYRMLPLPPSEVQVEPEKRRTTSLRLKFVKSLGKSFELSPPVDEKETGSTVLAEQRKIIRFFVPFSTVVSTGADGDKDSGRVTYDGVFFTGENPSWILKTRKGPIQIYPSGHSIVHAFTPCSLWQSKSDFLVYSDEGPCLLEWIPQYEYTAPLAYKSVPMGRKYSNVAFDPSTGLVVASSRMEASFALYDEDGKEVWDESGGPFVKGKGIDRPTSDCSALELISGEGWIVMDGFEFANNEFVNTISIVNLETASTDSGTKDFIAVGTTVSRGEDLAARGAVYVFEIVEVVPLSDQNAVPKRWWKLRLRCKDEAKGVVTNICGFSGYLVHSMGQKVFVRAFDLDERLVGVAFLDVGVYVTSLRTIKNLLLIGDAVKSLLFVAFQEDPYKLVILGRDVNHLPVCTTRAEFFFKGDELTIIACDDEGVLRMYDYSPLDQESNDGRHLLLRTEFQSQAEYRTSVVIARRTKNEVEIPQSVLLYGSVNGSLATLTPVDDNVGKRFQLLQGQLTRNVQHVAGLNPRAFRIVRNDFVSKPLSKGILDGNLLEHFPSLNTVRQAEMTRQIGTDKSVILRDWSNLVAHPW